MIDRLSLRDETINSFRYPIEMENAMTRHAFNLAVVLFCCMPAIPAFAEDTFTSPQTLVNVTIEPFGSGDGRDLVFTGAKLFYVTIQSAFHVESQRERPDLANRTQDVAILQSELVRYNVRQLRFHSAGGEEIDVEEVQSRLKKNPLALLLPDGASIHPQLAAVLNPETIVVTRSGSRATPQRLIPRPDGR